MRDEDKTRGGIIEELGELRQRVAELEASEMERRQMWEGLKAEKSKMDSIVNSITSGIDIIRYDYRVQYQNRFLMDRFGDIKGKLCYKEYMNRKKPCSDCPMRRAIEHNRAERTELLGADERYYEVLSTPIQNPDGTLSAFEVVMDITERKRVEEALQDSEEKFRLIAESLPDLVYEFDMEGKFVYVNEAATHLFGYSKDEMLSDIRVQDTVVEEDRVHLRNAMNDIMKGKTTVGERTLIRRDGSTFIGEIHSRPVYKGKEVVGVRGILRDITERKRAEEVLREREAELVIKTNSLEEANTALGVLMRKMDEDKTELEEKVVANVKELVVPFLEKIRKNPLDPQQVAYLDILESNLNAIISPFLRTLSAKYINLTPREIQIANLIKDGKNNKQMGEIMAVSPRTIETHRKNMRRKLGLGKKKGNLRSYLLSFQ